MTFLRLNHNLQNVTCGEYDALSESSEEGAAKYDGPQRLVVPATDKKPRAKEPSDEVAHDLQEIHLGVEGG